MASSGSVSAGGVLPVYQHGTSNLRSCDVSRCGRGGTSRSVTATVLGDNFVPGPNGGRHALHVFAVQQFEHACWLLLYHGFVGLGVSFAIIAINRVVLATLDWWLDCLCLQLWLL